MKFLNGLATADERNDHKGTTMKRLFKSAFIALFICLLAPFICNGENEPSANKKQSRALKLPYGFYNENFGASVGYVYAVHGFKQKQASLISTVMAGSKGSAMGFLMGTDFRLPWSDRLFLDPVVSVGYFSDADAYIDGNPVFPDERAGSNDSDKNDFLSGDGWDNFFRLRFKYLLPMGNGKNKIIPDYVLDNGLLKSGATGGHSLNPFRSGRTFLELRPFYRSQQVDGEYIDDDIRTNGLDAAFFWDNRDFYLNPSNGNSFRLKVSRDFGALDSSNSWTSMEAEMDAYYSLGASEKFRQRVLAFNFWTSYSPSWEKESDGGVNGRPPAYSGATLGGLWRMKGYPTQRFSDKSAIYYSAEYRITPEWNPFDNWQWLQKHVGVQWLQFTPFVEIGRVSPDWEIDELHSDMKWCLGLGVRAMAKGLVVRVDTAVSDESVNIQMMVNHPFQF